MFEQSLLIDHAGARKTATFAASLTAQILVAGVLLVAPLFYHEVLPALRMPEIVPVLTMWRPPEAACRRVPLRRPIERARIAQCIPAARCAPIRLPAGRHGHRRLRCARASSDSGHRSFPIGSSTTLPRFEGPTASPVKPEIVKPLETPVRVGGDVQSAKLIKQVVPVYPRLHASSAFQVRSICSASSPRTERSKDCRC